MPVSRTTISKLVLRFSAMTATVPPAGVNLMAFDSKFSITWRSRM